MMKGTGWWIFHDGFLRILNGEFDGYRQPLNAPVHRWDGFYLSLQDVEEIMV
jgi:hypothetical protein